MKSKVKAAVGQVEIVSLDPKRNVARMKQCVEEVLDEKEVDLILFPELANTGYIIAGDLDFAREFRKCAEPVQGYTTDTMCELSKKYKISRERVRQIETKAFEKLQTAMLNAAKSNNLLPKNLSLIHI